ncbi:hypothetical protein ACQ5SK_04585 [Bradyrhizobium japonicum]|nr:hypothetical protein BJ6T_34660 [Bradyrhizobium japonicum USDA 6]
MFWVTQAGCDSAIEVKETREISVPARTANELVISAPGADKSLARLDAKYGGPPACGQTASGRIPAIAAMLKPNGDRYSAHAMNFSGYEAVAAAARTT